MLDPAATTTGGSSTVRQVAALGQGLVQHQGAPPQVRQGPRPLGSELRRRPGGREARTATRVSVLCSDVATSGNRSGHRRTRSSTGGSQRAGARPDSRRTPCSSSPGCAPLLSLSLCSLFLFAYCLEKKIIMLQ